MRPEERQGRVHARMQKGPPGSRNSVCKGPVEQSSLVGVGNSKEASVR